MTKSVLFVFALFTVSVFINPVNPAAQPDPYCGYRYQVMIDGKIALAFSEVSGYNMSDNAVKYTAGAEIISPRKLPGLKKYANVSLKKGIINPGLTSGWIDSASAGKKIVGKKLTINMLDQNSKIAASWDFTNAVSVKSVKSTKQNNPGLIVYDSVEFSHEGFIRTK